MRTVILTWAAVAIIGQLQAQHEAKKSVIIGSFTEKPNALLALNPPEGNQGFLLPQLTSFQRLSINPQSPADDGLMVYDVTEKSFFFWQNAHWIRGLGQTSLTQSVSFDDKTQTLHLTEGGFADLSTLKELPSLSAVENGKFLSVDGNSLVWKDIVFNEDQRLQFNSSTKELSLTESSTVIDLSTLSVLDKTMNTGVLIGAAGNIMGVTGNAAGQVLQWNGSSWIAGDESQIFSDHLSVQGDGTKLNTLSVKSNGITQIHLSDNSVGAIEIQDNAVGAAELADRAVDTDALQDGTITHAKLGTSSVGVSNLMSGGINKVLTTDGAGAVSWSDKRIFSDSQNLSLTGNILNIDRGVAADLNALTVAGGVIGGALNNLSIIDGSITAADLSNGGITAQKIAGGGADKVLSTDVSGNVTWTDKTAIQLDASTTNETITAVTLTNNQLSITEASTIQNADLNALTLMGDVTGSINANVVTGIQGQAVQSGTPTEGKILKWLGGKWAFADDETSSVQTTIVTKYDNLDVAEFAETNDPIFENDHNIYRVFGPTSTFGYMGRRDKIKDIVAGLHVPHGSELKGIKGYLWDNEANSKEVEIKLIRKELATGNLFEVASAKTSGASPSIQTIPLSVSLPIDNSLHIYFVQIHFDLGPNDYVADKLSLINQRLYGVSYEYVESGNVVSGPGGNQMLYVGTTAPSTPYSGQVWLDTTSQLLKYWDGTTWVQHQ